ncbi:hypothetical protein [Streptomyces sp. NBC_01643]|uniref:hypothetical protein n=1 Tax=Streptomyces sp. NBC_01643 TaxID=2975906 RepID=UPI0038656716|nr:hypothetical protein OHB03_35870 [Streptomyces sp. NBC_01643]
MTAVRDLQVVLGAGPAGTALARELADRGHPVRRVDRAGGGAAIEGAERFAAEVATADDARYLAAHAEGRLRVVLGRSADFVGPGVLNSTLGGAVFPAALTGGEVPALGDIDLPHSYTYIADVAAGLATLGAHPDSDGRVWHLPTAPALTTRQIFTMIEQRTGRPLDITIVDEPRPVGPFDEVFMAEYAEMFYQHTEPQVVDSSAIEKAYGLTPNPLPATVDATLAWYEQLLAAH